MHTATCFSLPPRPREDNSKIVHMVFHSNTVVSKRKLHTNPSPPPFPTGNVLIIVKFLVPNFHPVLFIFILFTGLHSFHCKILFYQEKALFPDCTILIFALKYIVRI